MNWFKELKERFGKVISKALDDAIWELMSHDIEKRSIIELFSSTKIPMSHSTREP